MSYAWMKELESGHREIDEQHRELFEAFNALFDACARGEGRKELLHTLDFLEWYTRKHLADEERLMKEHSYPNYAAHKTRHNVFRRQIAAITEEYHQNDIDLSLVAKVNSVLASWLADHVQNWDVQLAAYLRTQS